MEGMPFFIAVLRITHFGKSVSLNGCGLPCYFGMTGLASPIQKGRWLQPEILHGLGPVWSFLFFRLCERARNASKQKSPRYREGFRVVSG
jgi:hypothetical protein